MSRTPRDLPSVSVITICWNDLAGLRRTVDSVMDQSHPDWELIIVDGGSTDGTADYLSSLDDPRIHWSSGPDGGIYDAMNKGLAQVQGELVLIVNSADALSSPESMRTYVSDHDERGWEWAYAAIRLTDTLGVPVGAYSFDPFKRWRFLMGLDWIPFTSVCFTRELLSQIGDFRTDLGSPADQELLMRAAGVADPRVITWFLADFALGGTSQSVGPRERELAWHKMRLANGLAWRGSAIADRAVAEALALRKPLRQLAKRIGAQR